MSSKRTLIGTPPNHWMWSPQGYDLTRPVDTSPSSPLPSPTSSISLSTSDPSTSITIDPFRSALVLIDMQNFFLSPSLGKSPSSAGLQAQSQILAHAIPAARKAGIQVIWLNWGLDDSELAKMPANTRRSFGFAASLKAAMHGDLSRQDPAVNTHGVNEQLAKEALNGANTSAAVQNPAYVFRGLGSEIGEVTLPDGTTVDGGRLLFRDTWNASLTPELDAAYRAGQVIIGGPRDMWIHKNRMSGLWEDTPCVRFLREQGITTLLFGGVNTDQCVAGSLVDASSKGFDCVLLSDACGTTSPEYVGKGFEWNASHNHGFMSDCVSFARGVDGMMKARGKAA